MARAVGTEEVTPTASCSASAASNTAAPARRTLAASAVAAAAAAAVLVATTAALAPPPALAAADQAAIAATFALKCAGCHAGGGNVLQAGATLATADLERNGYADADALFALIYKGKGRMPGFGIDCAPKGQCTFGPRFTDDEVKGMAEFVLRRAGEGWVGNEGAPGPMGP
jgi:cytochrome c6